MADNDSRRWLAISVFILASSLSFLDRQVLAALAPTIQADFSLTATQYGYILSVFSIAYALSSPLAGWFIDRAGLNYGITASVGIWSAAGLATAFTGSFPSLLACRTVLGIAESGGIPASGKAYAVYLRPQERALGAALGQIGISVGLVAAPVLAGAVTIRYGWRSAFVVAGILGFFWIPIWHWVSSHIPRSVAETSVLPSAIAAMLRDRRLWGLVAGNVLGMTTYSLWINWTTVFLVRTQGLTQQEANLRFAWAPPLFAALGGLAGGAISLRLAKAGGDLPQARLRVIFLSAIALLATAIIPHLPGPVLVTAAICWSFFWSVALSVNVYALPLDYFGAGRAASAVAALTFAYGMMQTFLSPAIGRMVDLYGFSPVCALTAVFPLGAAAVLHWTRQPS